MIWTDLQLVDQVEGWLIGADANRYAKERRIDPFATSMRDFDDVSVDLQELHAGIPLSVIDSAQRITDLRSAGLVDAERDKLGTLGTNVCEAWQRYNVANDNKFDELGRCLVLVIEAIKNKNPEYENFRNYWRNLRAFINPFQLINWWDKLIVLNYLDFERDGFAPGLIYRESGVNINEIGFDLIELVEGVREHG